MLNNNYFYIIKNNDWKHLNAIKYGVTNDPFNRINKCDQHPIKNEYIYLFIYNKMSDYIFKGKYDEPDKIISIISRNPEKQEKLMKKFNLKYLDKINEFIINENGGTEFINNDGINILLSIILEDFPKLGLEIIKVNSNEIEKINKNNLGKSIEEPEFSFYDYIENIPILRSYQNEICNYIINKYENHINKIFK